MVTGIGFLPDVSGLLRDFFPEKIYLCRYLLQKNFCVYLYANGMTVLLTTTTLTEPVTVSADNRYTFLCPSHIIHQLPEILIGSAVGSVWHPSLQQVRQSAPVTVGIIANRPSHRFKTKSCQEHVLPNRILRRDFVMDFPQ